MDSLAYFHPALCVPRMKSLLRATHRGATHRSASRHPGPTADRLRARESTDLRWQERRKNSIAIFMARGRPQASSNCWRTSAQRHTVLFGSFLVDVTPGVHPAPGGEVAGVVLRVKTVFP